MKGNIGFTPILEKLRDAVNRAANAPRRRRAVTRGISEDNFSATAAERNAFHAMADDLIGGRYAIKPAPNRKFEIWDAESSAVYGPYRTYSDAAVAAERLP